MTNTVKVKEIFTSIQGEGPYVGVKQLFIRFCNCNLKCNYCDTEFSSDKDYVEYTPIQLATKAKEFDLPMLHSISLTGGEPLLSVDFLEEFLPLVGSKIYLETNATLVEKYERIKQYIDIVAADIKLQSATGIKGSAIFHDKFFEGCIGKECFAKIVFDDKITDDEIHMCTNLSKKYGLELILQPKMNGDEMAVSIEFAEKIFDKFLQQTPNVRLIPQVHKFLSVR